MVTNSGLVAGLKTVPVKEAVPVKPIGAVSVKRMYLLACSVPL